MQAIQVKTLPTTNFKPLRVKAYAQAGSVTLSWDYGFNLEQNHAAAVMAFLDKFKWSGNWAGGTLKNGQSVYVCVSDPSGIVVTGNGGAKAMADGEGMPL